MSAIVIPRLHAVSFLRAMSVGRTKPCLMLCKDDAGVDYDSDGLTSMQEYTYSQIGGFTLLLVNLDDFKRINEGMGLPAGERTFDVVKLVAFAKGQPFSASFQYFVYPMLLFGLGWGFFDCNNMPILCQIARPEHRATGYGFMNLVSISVGAGATVVLGWMRDQHIPFSIAFAVSAAFCSIFSPLVFSRSRVVENFNRDSLSFPSSV